VKKETVVIIVLLVLRGLLGVSEKYISGLRISDTIISPFSSSFSVFAMLQENRREQPEYTVYGFLPYWTLGKSNHLQYERLTDIAYFGLRIEPGGKFQTVQEDGTPEPGFNAWRNSEELKAVIQKAKISGTRVSLTVISHKDSTSDSFLDCDNCWITFINELFTELDHHKISSVNLNFEYGSYTDRATADKYTQFSAFVKEELSKKYEDPYVVVSTFADSLVKPRVTAVEDLAKYVDGIFIMAYDFHRPDSDITGPVSPIGGAGVHAEYDINTMIKDYLRAMPKDKIIMGVPYYGYNWVIGNPNKRYAERIPGRDDIGFSKSQTYENIMETILTHHPRVEWDNLGLSPYFSYVSKETGSNRQVYFDNSESLKIKYQLIKKHELLGVGIWALGYDGGYQELWNLLGEEFGRSSNE
jgi:spore germination protein